MSEPAPRIETPFTRDVGIRVPVICGAMYPCSNPELVAAVSEAGGIGVVQPISLTYVHGYGFREGLRRIRELTSKPIGFNAIIEKSVKAYERRMREWVDIALEEDVRFFVTAPSGNVYMIEMGRYGNVYLVKDGEKTKCLCAHPSGRVPNEDTILAQKLHLEAGMEDPFLKIANEHHEATWSREIAA